MVLLMKREVVSRILVPKSHSPKAIPRGAPRVVVLEVVAMILYYTSYFAKSSSQRYPRAVVPLLKFERVDRTFGVHSMAKASPRAPLRVVVMTTIHCPTHEG